MVSKFSSPLGSAKASYRSMIFHTIKKISLRFCAFLFLVVAVCAVDVDAPACVDGAGTVFHVGGMAGLGVGPPPAVAPPAKRC